EIDADAAPGLYPLRAISEDGLSNALLFRVDTVSEVSERSLRDGIRDSSAATEAPRIDALPVVVNGTLDGAERDRYRFRAEAGERVVLEVEARRVGSAIDPVLRLLDSEGSEIASNQEGPGIDVDARLDWQPPEAGEYVVEVHDARYSDQRRNFYRLKLIAASDYEYADAVFPLGVRRGEETRFGFAGGSAATTREVTRAADTDNAFDSVGPPVATKASAALPFRVIVGNHPEVLESETAVDETLGTPVVVNGRIDDAGEVDRYRIDAEPGQRLLIEVEGAALGSSDLFGVLTVATPDGEYLASSGDDIPDPDTFRLLSPTATSFDPWVVVEAPAGVDELHVAVEDLVGRGGPRFGYRLTATANGPDFELRLGTAQLTLNNGASKPIEVGAVR
ncbi:MAG: PPC domain-containing protein, partial [Acidobacteriota bacterium]|nr:PPC domain-containing protein [Acidobacteriota bacterium]